MRSFHGMAGFVLLTSLVVVGCNSQEAEMRASSHAQVLSTLDQAARKGRDDLVSALRSTEGLDVGADVAAVERSEPGKPVRRLDVSFDKLLSADAITSFDAVVDGERDTVVPLVVGRDVVTIVEVRKDESGWRVVGLAGKDIADDLNTLRKGLGDPDSVTITLYEVPNLHARVYGVRQLDAERLFTDYGTRFSLREGVDVAALIAVLKADAVEFQRKYGPTLKRERLLR